MRIARSAARGVQGVRGVRDVRGLRGVRGVRDARARARPCMILWRHHSLHTAYAAHRCPMQKTVKVMASETGAWTRAMSMRLGMTTWRQTLRA